MIAYRLFLCLLLVSAPSLALGQKRPKNASPVSLDSTVCKIGDDPSSFNNKLVNVRGHVQASFEYSMLLDESCPEKALWFLFADGSAPPGLEVMLNGKARPGGKDSAGRIVGPVPVQLVRDSNLELLEHYWALSAKGAACAEGPPPADLPPDCTTYRVTATFTGRIDSISRQVQEARRKRKNREGTDWKGFGHMGIFDAQIVVQSVEQVVAINEAETRGTAK
jgi:hypothetical protein